MRPVSASAAAIAPPEIVFRDRLIAMFCAILVGCSLLFLH
jgi:hypothetical protein